ncbi:hypothetical protein N2W54_003253 [Lotmaria passim]
MEANRPSSAKWVSRRTLDSQAHNRDHSAGMQDTRGRTSHVSMENSNITNPNSNMERRKYGNMDMAAQNTSNMRGSSGGNGGGGYRTNSRNRFGASGSGNSAGGAWGTINANPCSGVNKLNHHNMGYAANAVNLHPPHNPGGHHHHSGGGRRGHGSNNGGGGYGEPIEATMPPPPRSVQMGQGMLPTHSTAATRDLIPQPRHAKVSSSIINGTSKSMDNSASTPALEALATRRWASTTPTPTPCNANSNPAATPATAAVLRSSPASPFTTGANGGARGVSAAAPPLPSPTPPNAAVFAGVAGGPAAAAVTTPGPARPSSGSGNAVPPPPPGPPPSSSAAPAPRSYATAGGAAKPPLTSPLDALHLSQDLIFDARDFDEPMAIQPSEIEALLGQVERSTAAVVSASKETAMSGSLRERRSVTDWGIEEAIKSVLPGMDEDDNSDDMPGPHTLSGGMTAISGSWHTCGGELDARQSAGAGLLADFPTSFAASFSEPVSAVLGSPFAGEPAANAMDNLSRAFSTAVRADSSSFTTSPALTSTATPLQRPPNSPGLHLTHYTSPDDAVAMPTSAREMMPPLPPAPHTAAVALVTKEEATNDSLANASELLTLYPAPPPSSTTPWLASGMGESVVAAAASRASDTAVDLAVSKVSSGGGSAEQHLEKPVEKPAAKRPSLLQALATKNGSSDSSFGLTASASANSPACPPTRQSTVTNSAPNTPSLRKDATTPLSANRSQAYTTGSTRPQRPSLSAPLVNRQTITQIFRETPQSLLRKERMVHNHEVSPQALCKDPHWPPRTCTEVEEMLRARNAVKLQRHLVILCFSRQNVAGVQELFDTWAKNGIPAPDMGFGAYYYYVKEKSDKLLCMKHNGRGPSPGHGYGRCDFESRRPYSTCRYEHVCLFCRSKEHGWFEEGKCVGYQQLLDEMEQLGIVEEDIVTLLNAMERGEKKSTVR